MSKSRARRRLVVTVDRQWLKVRARNPEKARCDSQQTMAEARAMNPEKRDAYILAEPKNHKIQKH